MPLPVRPIAVAAVVVIVAVAALAVYQSMGPVGPVTTAVPTSFTVSGKTFAFNYTAVTEAERESGLMNKRVTGSTAMLFAFPALVRQTFWMYQTNTSLDMIWVNASGTSGVVVYVQTDAPPCLALPCPDYPSVGQAPLANYVIEAKAGFAAANGVRLGTELQFSY